MPEDADNADNAAQTEGDAITVETRSYRTLFLQNKTVLSLKRINIETGEVRWEWEGNADSLLSVYAEERDELEAAWIADPPEPAKAFAEGDHRLAAWERRVEAAMWGHPDKRGKGDQRPAYVRHFWEKRDQRSGRHAETDGADPAGS